MKKFLAWLKAWFRTAIDAASRLAFYREAPRKTTSALAHLAMLTLVFWVLPFAVVFFLGVRHGISTIADGLRREVPVGTTFELKDGHFTDTLTAPVVIASKDFTLVINTATSTMALPADADGLIVNPDGLIQQQGGQTEAMSFVDAPAFKATREELLADIARWTPLTLFLGSVLALGAVFTTYALGFVGSVAGHAFALWIAFKLFRRPRRWVELFVLAAYAATAPIVLQAILSIFGVTSLDLIPNLLYWSILGWILYDAVKRNPPVPRKGETHERQETEAAVDRPDRDRRLPA